jgi:cyclopropane fatty-acyl-phospholipid synthase-like methyltransferase
MSDHPDWYRTFFTGLFAEAARHIPYQTDAELDYLMQVLAVPPGGHILDVPCGTGRLSVPLAERGYRVTGVDISAELLGDAEAAAKGRNLPVRFEERDMRDLPWAGEFDAAYCAGNSFTYLGETGDRDFLAAVARNLKPGGRFSLETSMAAESVFVNRLQRAWFPLGDLLFLHDTDYEPATSKFTSTYTIIRAGKKETKRAVYQIYTCRQIVRLLEDAGFGQIESYGSLTREPYKLGNPTLRLVATRQ